MAALIRVKRSLSDDPLDAFILNCKKRKISTNENENQPAEVSTILQFAGTVDSEVNIKEQDIFKHIKKPTKADLEENYKKHLIDLNSKLRSENQLESKNNRYKVVNLFRSQESTSQSNEDSKSELTILDIEADINQNVSQDNFNELKFVYDLYYTASNDLGDAQFEDVSVVPLSENLVYGSYRDNGLNADNSDSDSEDSNAENYFTNDYPDESDVESVNEGDIRNAVQNIHLDDTLSSDGEDKCDNNLYNDSDDEAEYLEEIDSFYKSDDYNIYYDYSDDE